MFLIVFIHCNVQISAAFDTVDILLWQSDIVSMERSLTGSNPISSVDASKFRSDPLYLLIFKKLSSTLLESLTPLYTSFLSVGRIPDERRRAVVMPIHKGGSADDVSNYRPIALTSVFSKIMERVVASKISSYMLQHGLINKQQH